MATTGGYGASTSQQTANAALFRSACEQSGEGTLGVTTNLNQSHQGRKDTGQIVRKWNVKFKGTRDENVDAFITRVEECRTTANLTDDELVQALPEMLEGLAMDFFRNRRDSMHSWRDFTVLAREWFGMGEELQQRLMSDAHMRTQRKGELVREFFIQLEKIIRRIHPPLEPAKQLDLFYRNLRPEYQQAIVRTDMHNIDELFRRAIQLERSFQAEQTFREAPAPEHFLMPDAAMMPPRSTVKVAEVDLSSSVAMTLEQINRRLQQLDKSYGLTGHKNANGRSSPKNEEEAAQ